MKTINTKNNATITVGNITMSAPAYEEFYELRMEVENSKVFRSWDVNPYFLIALYDYYRAEGRGCFKWFPDCLIQLLITTASFVAVGKRM